jgi:hypothetical protein
VYVGAVNVTDPDPDVSVVLVAPDVDAVDANVTPLPP